MDNTEKFRNASTGNISSNSQKPWSKIELEALKKQRDRPELKYEHYTPDGGNNPENDRKRSERERRIAYIEAQIKNNKNRARDSFKRSR